MPYILSDTINSSVTGNTTGGSVLIPAKSFVVAFNLKTTETQNVTVGTAPGGNDVFAGQVIANENYEVAINKKYDAPTLLYIGHAGAAVVTIEVYKL